MAQKKAKNYMVRLRFNNLLHNSKAVYETTKEVILLADDPRLCLQDVIIQIDHIINGPFQDAVKEASVKMIIVHELQEKFGKKIKAKPVFVWATGNKELPTYDSDKIMEYFDKLEEKINHS